MLVPFLLRAQDERVSVTIEYPGAGAVITNSDSLVLVTARAHVGTPPENLDLVFVIDASDSTERPSGADVDGDGKTGRTPTWTFSRAANTDPGDSVLAAEIAAVQTLLEQLDSRTTRVGVVYFSGDLDPRTPDAATQVALTTNYSWVRDGLDDILRYGPHGRTNMLAGINVATAELLGEKSAVSEPRGGARKVMIFLTDGTPTLPIATSPNHNMRLAIRAARQAARHDIRIDTYAIGEHALSEPVVVVEMAHVTRGVFTPVQDPKDLRSTVTKMNLSDIEEMLVANQTTGRDAQIAIQGVDGWVSALVPLETGKNLIDITARSTSGGVGHEEVEIEYRREPGPGPADDWHRQVRARLLKRYEFSLRSTNLDVRADDKE